MPHETPAELAVHVSPLGEVVIELGPNLDDENEEIVVFSLSPEFARHFARLLTVASIKAEGDWKEDG